MHSELVPVKGMHCASCAAIIKKNIKKQDGVENVEVNYGTETAKIVFDPRKTSLPELSKKLEPLGYSLHSPTAKEMNMSENEHSAHLGINLSQSEKIAELRSLGLKLKSALPLAAIAGFVMFWEIFAAYGFAPMMNEVWSGFFRRLMPVSAAYMLFFVGQPYLSGLYRFIRYGQANMDTLIGLGTLAAFVYSFVLDAFSAFLAKYFIDSHSYYDVTIVVIAFITLGKYLETRAKIKTGSALEKLLNLQAKTAWVIRDGLTTELPVDRVVPGDQILIKPGGRLPVDGLLEKGEAFIDESMITGESMPVEKKPGDGVSAGTINTTGSFVYKATKVGADTLLARIVNMVREAQGSRAPVQALADRISEIFVPSVLVIASITFALWLVFAWPAEGFSIALSQGLSAFVGILVIACPCALGLATPTAIIVGVGKGAEEGILIKDAATLEKLGKASVVILDKTGTITHGKPEFVAYKNFSTMTDEQSLAILSALESRSEHPIAGAVVNHAKKINLSFSQVEKFEALKGRGLQGWVDGKRYLAGNLKLLSEFGIAFDQAVIEKETSLGQTPIILFDEKSVLGAAFVADKVKPQAESAVRALIHLGIKPIMLTGDHFNTASAIAKSVGINEFYASVLPDEKMRKVRDLQRSGQVVAMAGDGINDAPALAAADIGIAMATGTDVAIETAGVTLLHGDISKLVKAIRLSKLTMRGIRQNLFWAFIYNLVGIPIAGGWLYPFFGWLLSPVFAGMAMALSSVSVVANSLRLKFKKV